MLPWGQSSCMTCARREQDQGAHYRPSKRGKVRCFLQKRARTCISGICWKKACKPPPSPACPCVPLLLPSPREMSPATQPPCSQPQRQATCLARSKALGTPATFLWGHVRQGESRNSVGGAGREALTRQREHAVTGGFLQRRFVAASSESLSHAPTSHLPKYRGTGCKGSQAPWKRNVRMRSSTIAPSVTRQQSPDTLRHCGNTRTGELFSKNLLEGRKGCASTYGQGFCVFPPSEFKCSLGRAPRCSQGRPQVPVLCLHRGGEGNSEHKAKATEPQPCSQQTSSKCFWGHPPASHPRPLETVSTSPKQVLGTKAPARLQHASGAVCCRVKGSCNREMEARTRDPEVNSNSQVG